MSKPNVFVIMPFSTDYMKTFEFLQKKLKDSYNIINANSENMQSIMKDVVNGINDADFVIADLTEVNANVYYELGIAHALRRKVITITQKINELPFDLKAYRAIPYILNYNYADKFIDDIKTILDKGVKEEIEFSNPVIDYLEGKKKDKIVIKEINEGESISEDDKGYIDLVTDINLNMNQISDSVIDITSKMNYMTEKMNEKTEQINRLKETKKVDTINVVIDQTSKIINNFSCELGNFNDFYDITWTRITNDYNHLIENKFIISNKDNNSLTDEIEALVRLKESKINVKDKLGSYKTSVEGLIGAKASLTRASKALIKNLDAFDILFQNAIKDIDKIVEKHKVLYLD